MNKPEELLQERLERLESGESPDVCVQGLPDVEADLLKLTYRLRQLQYPARDDEIVASQRQTLLALATRGENMKKIDKWIQRFLPNIVTWTGGRRAPYMLVGGAVLIVVACTLTVILLTGKLRPGESPLSTPQDITSIRETIAPGATPEVVTDDATSEATLATAESAYNVFIPLLAKPLTLSPQRAALQDVHGLVEVQIEPGIWTSVLSARTLSVGQRVRTGPLSSVRLVFYDGSQIRLGSDTEVSIDELDARQESDPRVVVLTQWIGRSEHDVVPAIADGSHYKVHTPSATGSAEGTRFSVVVTPARSAHFYVEEGAIAVTGTGTTILVEAGEATAVAIDTPPEDPVFRITGEGMVSSIGAPTGEPWVIAGQPFEVHADTIIMGDPQVGDWVSVEGYLRADNIRVAREITLLRRAPVNQFTLHGYVDAIMDDVWTVAGQSITISATTQIDADIEVGALVYVEGTILEEGVLQATSISLVEDDGGGLPFDFTGVVQAVGPEILQVSGVPLAIDRETQVDSSIAVGDLVHARGWIQADGTWLARSLERVSEQAPMFTFTGRVEHIEPWLVAGIAFETRTWTQIDEGINIDEQVRVTGQISDDGTWVAFEIEKIDEGTKISIILIGTLTSLAPWSVNDIPIVVDATTILAGDLEIGTLVRVEIQLLADGTWRVLEIRPLEMGWGQGCLVLKAIVVDITEGQIQLASWPPIALGEDLEIEGTLKSGSVIWLQACFTEDGGIKILYIIVIGQPEPEEVTPQPTEPLPAQEDPNSKVTICHKPNSKNPHTITVSRSALPAHLEHGDTLGPCP
jgi:mannose-6-phosphate isomerase-like protein (cupin superfamily)